MAAVQFRILGPLEVSHDDHVVGPGQPKQRLVLAMLLLSPNRFVPADRLVDELWPDCLPAAPTASLRTQVSRLRKSLAPLGTDPIASLAGGYSITVHGGELDSWVFEHLVADARRSMAAECASIAAKQFEAALALWRGPPLAEFLFAEFAQPEIARLEEMRIGAIEDHVECRLVLGQHRELVGDLEALVREHPLRERLWASLMLSMYRSGRHAEALDAYQDLRRSLGGRLGIEPGETLKQLEEAILLGRGDLDWSPSARASTSESRRVGTFPFVGRHAEWATLEGAWEGAQRGIPSAVMVAGEPGIGKSRLLREFASHVSSRGAVVLHGRADEHLAMPYQCVAEALRCHCADREAMQRAAERFGTELVQVFPELSSKEASHGGPGIGDDDDNRYRIYETVLDLVASISRDAPVLLVLDDLHWAASGDVSVVRHLLRSQRTIPFLLLAAHRPLETALNSPLAATLADLRSNPLVRRLTLSGLDVSEVGEMLEAMKGFALNSEETYVAEVIQSRTTGNAFFVTELIRTVTELGGWPSSGVGRIATEAIPTGVSEVIDRRLAALPATAREVLRLAAVAAPHFTLPLLERAVEEGGAEDVLDAVELACGAHLLVERDDHGGGYEFAHGIVADCIYAGLSRPRRAGLHRRIGEVLEQLPHRGGLGVSRLLYHFDSAAGTGCDGKAASYALVAAREALAQAGWEEAVILADVGLNALEREESLDRLLQCDLLTLVAHGRSRMGLADGARQACFAAAAIARALGDGRRLAAAALHYEFDPSSGAPAQFEEGCGLINEALRADIDDDLRARLVARLARHRATGGGEGPRAEEIGRRAYELARATGQVQAIVEAIDTQLITLMGSPRLSDRIALADQLLAYSDGPGVRSRGYGARASARISAGDIEGWMADNAACERLAVEGRNVDRRFVAMLWRGTSAMLDGRFDDADALTREALSLIPSRIATVGPRRGFVLAYERGSLRAFKNTLMASFETHRDDPSGPALWGAVALCHAELGEFSEARSLLETLAADDFSRIPCEQSSPGPLAWLAEACALVEDPITSSRLYELLVPYRGQLAVVGCLACLGSTDRYLGMLAATRGHFEAAAGHFRHALGAESRLGLQVPLAHTQYWFARALLHQDDSELRAQAQGLLANCSATARRLGMAGLAKAVRDLEPIGPCSGAGGTGFVNSERTASGERT